MESPNALLKDLAREREERSNSSLKRQRQGTRDTVGRQTSILATRTVTASYACLLSLGAIAIAVCVMPVISLMVAHCVTDII